MGTAEAPFARGLDKEDVVHKYYKIIILIHKKETLKFVTIRLYLENITLSKTSKAEKVKNPMSALILEI